MAMFVKTSYGWKSLDETMYIKTSTGWKACSGGFQIKTSEGWQNTATSNWIWKQGSSLDPYHWQYTEDNPYAQKNYGSCSQFIHTAHSYLSDYTVDGDCYKDYAECSVCQGFFGDQQTYPHSGEIGYRYYDDATHSVSRTCSNCQKFLWETERHNITTYSPMENVIPPQHVGICEVCNSGIVESCSSSQDCVRPVSDNSSYHEYYCMAPGCGQIIYQETHTPDTTTWYQFDGGQNIDGTSAAWHYRCCNVCGAEISTTYTQCNKDWSVGDFWQCSTCHGTYEKGSAEK